MSPTTGLSAPSLTRLLLPTSYSSLYVNGCTLFYLVSNPADIPRTFSRIVFPEGSSFELLPGTIFLRSRFQRPHSSHIRPAYAAGTFIVRWAVTVPGLGDECGYSLAIVCEFSQGSWGAKLRLLGPPISAHVFVRSHEYPILRNLAVWTL